MRNKIIITGLCCFLISGYLTNRANAVVNHTQTKAGQQQEIVVAQGSYRGNSTDLNNLAQRARLAGREAHKLEVRSQQKKSLSPAMQAELKAKSRAKLAEQQALLKEYRQRRRNERENVMQQQQARRNITAEKERIRRSHLTPEQSAAQDKALMNNLGTIIGVMGMVGADDGNGGNGSVDCTQNPNALECTGVPNNALPQSKPDTSIGFNCRFTGSC